MFPNKPQLLIIAKYFLFLFYFSAIYQFLCFVSNVAGFVGLRESFFITFMLLIPLLLFAKWSKPIAAFLGLLLWAASLPSLGYYLIYKQEFSQSVIFILFESNIHEGSEFFKTYFEWWMLPAILVYSYIPYRIWKSLKPIHVSIKSQSFLIAASLIISMHTFIELSFFKNDQEKAITKQLDRMQNAAPWNLILSYVHYKNILKEMEQFLVQNEKFPPVSNLTNQFGEDQETLVLIIGESTNRNRMSLYGYTRNTSPMLSQLKNELIVFNHVYSPRPYTIEALQQILTFADQQHPTLYRSQTNLLNIMKQAGFETFWITNQQTQTKRNTLLTTFSKIANHQIYLNNNRSQNSRSYDEVVLQPFNNIIKDTKYKKKFVIVHLLGTHARYDYRYPKQFEKFNQEMPSKALSSREKNLYNSYDNAVLYNDYVVASLIKSVSKVNHKASLLYLSDHGEEVFDNTKNKKLGRNEYDPTVNMYSVPFILYANSYWNQSANLKKFQPYVDRIYSSSDFLHTYCDFIGLNFKELDHTKSLVSDQFINRDVWIGDPYNRKSMKTLSEITSKTL